MAGRRKNTSRKIEANGLPVETRSCLFEPCEELLSLLDGRFCRLPETQQRPFRSWCSSSLPHSVPRDSQPDYVFFHSYIVSVAIILQFQRMSYHYSRYPPWKYANRSLVVSKPANSRFVISSLPNLRVYPYFRGLLLSFLVGIHDDLYIFRVN